MRHFRILIAALLGIAGATVPASAQIFTVVGNNVEMYLKSACVPGSCGLAFPQNTTGRIIKITYVSCEIDTDGNNRLVFASIGPSVSSTNVVLNKRTFFDTSRSIANATDSTVYYLSATPGLMLGVGRYLAVKAIPNAGQIRMECAAAGTFAN